MAKTSKKKNNQLNPNRFLREQVRKQPLGKCYINRNWDSDDTVCTVVTRLHSNGNITAGIYVIDRICLGIKDTFVHFDWPPTRWEVTLEKLVRDNNLIEISYEEIHNFIYGAIEFAEEAGIHPVPEFSTSRYILKEDTDDIPLIEYNYGKNGQHHLVITPAGNEARWLVALEKNLGIGNFTFQDDRQTAGHIISNRLNSNYKAMMEEHKRHPSEPYTYTHPEYNINPSFTHPDIARSLTDPDNYPSLPDDEIDRILALPTDEVVADLSALIRQQIGLTWKEIENGTNIPVSNSSLVYSILLLGEIGLPDGLEPILEIMRQSDDFMGYHFGDIGNTILPGILYNCGRNDYSSMIAYLDEPGLNQFFRVAVYEALAMIVVHEPHRRQEIIEVFRKILNNMLDRIPRTYCCSANLAGMLTGILISIRATELIPELEALHTADCVDLSSCGDWESCKKNIQSPPDENVKLHGSFRIQTMKETSRWFESIADNWD